MAKTCGVQFSKNSFLFSTKLQQTKDTYMKKSILKLFTLLLCLPLALCGCSKVKSKLETIHLPVYYNTKVSCDLYGKSTSIGIDLDDLTSKKPKYGLIAAYTKFELRANAAWVYKLYIDYIYFKVYTNMASSELIVNVNITNLASESDLSKPNDDFTAECSLIPQADESFICEVKVQKVIATATGSTITFDILNSPEVFYDDFGKEIGFKWIIHDLKFYAEHRTYSK